MSSSNTLDSIKDYARSLLRSLSEKVSLSDELGLLNPPRHAGDDAVGNGKGSLSQGGKQNGPTHHDRLDDVRWTDLEKEAEGGLAGCREAVEILTRKVKKGVSCHNYL